MDGNLAVVEGTVARALGLAEGDAVLVELRGSAAALLSAAVRLGRLSPLTAQGVLLGLAPALAAAAEEARGLALADLASTAPALEIGLLAHSRAPTRFSRSASRRLTAAF